MANGDDVLSADRVSLTVSLDKQMMMMNTPCDTPSAPHSRQSELDIAVSQNSYSAARQRTMLRFDCDPLSCVCCRVPARNRHFGRVSNQRFERRFSTCNSATEQRKVRKKRDQGSRRPSENRGAALRWLLAELPRVSPKHVWLDCVSPGDGLSVRPPSLPPRIVYTDASFALRKVRKKVSGGACSVPRSAPPWRPRRRRF